MVILQNCLQFAIVKLVWYLPSDKCSEIPRVNCPFIQMITPLYYKQIIFENYDVPNFLGKYMKEFIECLHVKKFTYEIAEK